MSLKRKKKQIKRKRPTKLKKFGLIAVLLFLLIVPIVVVLAVKDQNEAANAAQSWPTTPPAQICSNTSLLSGPATAPSGAVTVPAGDNSNFNFRQANTTYWFAPGVHTLGSSEYGQIIPADNTTYIGAPGAVLDGRNINRYAFTQHARNVRIAYLEIRNFVSPRDEGVVNHDQGHGWTIEYNNIHHNKGAGVFAGTDNTLRYNCLADNGQYGFQVYSGDDSEVGPSNIVIDHNEVARNNTDNWEIVSPGCGCTGGAKFWLSNNTTVTNNWVHDNNSVGLWFDNNNRGAFIQNNYIENNYAQGLFIEAGYDAQVTSNTFKRNALGVGREFASRQDPFPIGAIYVSENGSPAGYGLKYVPLFISNNYFENNWGGVALWENADRYSGSSAHTHVSGTIKIGDLINDTKCKSGIPDDIPDTMDPYLCRWSTENIIVENNEFRIDKEAIGTGCAGANYCGISGIFANVGSYPEFSGYTIPWRITFQQGNIFRNNAYYGDWKFAGFQTTKPDGLRVSWQEWTASAPAIPATFTHANRPTTFGQDAGSTYNSQVAPTGSTPPTPFPTTPVATITQPVATPTSVPTPTPTTAPSGANILDVNTATLEGSKGNWQAWYSTSVTQSLDSAHSGAKSLKVAVTAPHGWGVQLGNWPGFAATAGNKTISYWGRLGSGKKISVTMRVQWFNANRQILKTDTVTINPLEGTWKQGLLKTVAPVGTATVNLELYSSQGNKGNILYFDDFVISNN